MNLPSSIPSNPPDAKFLGLAPFLRMSIAGIDLKPAGESILAAAQVDPAQADLWMNLSIVMHCMGHRDLGLTLQMQALRLQRVYHVAAKRQPARFRLLMLVMPGDLAANTPLDCLLEDSDIDLDFYFLGADEPFLHPLPEHDAVMVAMSEGVDNVAHLLFLEQALANWPKPVINLPQYISYVEREKASQLLQNIPGLLMPPTLRVMREHIQGIASKKIPLNECYDVCDFPIIMRPLGSQGGHDLAKLTNPEDMADYLSRVPDAYFFISRFIDYSHSDGFFRKIRVALIDGVPYACHMAVSSNWMIHYINAGMYDDAWKREEELAFMNQFENFKQRHQVALTAIAKAIPLDYVCMDCAETSNGELLVFELDHAMIVHAMDTEDQFPYKQIHMQKVKHAFCELLEKRIAPKSDEPNAELIDTHILSHGNGLNRL
jgi:glutathione synthase/RimK-type ligase-like ATP-grasp enzyme